MQGFFNICKTINVIHHINKLKNKTHIIIYRCRKGFWQNSAPIYDENSSKMGIEVTYLNLVKAIYDKVKESESEVAQLCLALCDPMDCSLPDSTVHGIFQARILEWVAISFSRRSSWPRDWTRVSRIVGRRFTISATREVIAYMISPHQTLFSKVKNWKHFCWD